MDNDRKLTLFEKITAFKKEIKADYDVFIHVSVLPVKNDSDMSSKPFYAIIDKVKEVFQDDDNIPASIKKLDFLKCRKKEIIVYKQLLFLFLRRKGYTLEKIGTALNTKHCTVIYGIKHINNLMEIKDEEVIFTYKKLEYELQAYF